MSLMHINSLITFFLLLLSSANASPKVPRLGLPRNKFLPNVGTQADSSQHDFKTFYYNQTLDHFSYRPESYTTFKQKYVINSKHWGGTVNGSCAPIFAYLGEEQAIDADVQIIGWLTENAPRFKALLLYIEHRFYGESIPYGLSLDKAIEDANIRGYFTSTQALADYAEVILHVKKKLEAENCPVIVFGASYGGMLAAWFRLKYPHIAHGSLASSAPILIINDFVPLYGYYNVVSKDFKETSETCYQTIKSSWSEINRVASEPNGLSSLSSMFQTCNPLTSANELKNYLILLYAGAAQYNDPQTKPVATFCNGINNSNHSTDSIIQKIFAGVVAYEGNWSCYVNFESNASQTDFGWSWQTCSEMVYTLALGDDSMFQPDPAPVQETIDYCTAAYGVPPRPHWASTYFGFGGGDIRLYLQRFGSNIIFSNGLVDPYSSGGVLEDLSSTLHAVYTTNGSHCLDVLPSQPGDPKWLVKQRKTEIGIVAKWIAKYYADLSRLEEKTH